MHKKYDLICSAEFSFSEERFSRLRRVDPVVMMVGEEKSTDECGYLEAKLTITEAIWLSKILKQYSIYALPISDEYLTSKISIDYARKVAQQYIIELRSTRPQMKFADVEDLELPWALSKVAFGFISKSKTIFQEEKPPNGIALCVDRLSGQIMTSREKLNIELLHMLSE